MEEQAVPPQNCCPTCGGTRFDIVVARTIVVAFLHDEDHDVVSDDDDNCEWDGDSEATCVGCGQTNRLRALVAR